MPSSPSTPIRLPREFVSVEKTLPSGKTITVVRVRSASRSNRSPASQRAPTPKRRPPKRT